MPKSAAICFRVSPLVSASQTASRLNSVPCLDAIAEDINEQNAVMVLESFEALDPAIYALYPHNRHLAAKVRAFVDFLVEEFAPEPVWERSLKN